MIRHLRWSLLALAPVAFSAGAFTPENGFYDMLTSDAGAVGGGTGLAVEIQNDYLFAVGNVYRPDGEPTFVTIEGTINPLPGGGWGLSNARDLYAFSGGQCIGTLERCPYRKPKSAHVGGFSIVFTAENEGHLEWGEPGNLASVTLRRSCVGSICYDTPSSLLGEWDVILERASTADGLRFGGDKLAIATVTPTGDRRTIGGCIAASDATAPDCAEATLRERIEGVATRCTDASCKGYRYQLVVRANGGRHRDRIVRVYTFGENGRDGGAFGGTIRGRVDLCAGGARTTDACTTHAGIPFVAYKSASVGFVRDGIGTN